MKNLVFALILCISTAALAEEFKVALPMLPDVHPVTNQINSGNYIGSHLYYPLFEKNPHGTESYFLDISNTKAIDKTFKIFQFCLKKDLKFSDGGSITVDDLIKSLRAMAEMYPQTLALKSEAKMSDNCAKITLTDSTPGLFGKLTGMASTVLKAGGNAKFYPTGIGPYTLKLRSENELKLESTSANKIRFNQVTFKLIKKSDEDVEKFTDINQLPPNSERDKKFEGNRIDAPSLKVYTFVLNVSDSKKRDAIRLLLENENWAEAFGLNLLKAKYFLPWLNSSYEISNSKRLVRSKNKIAFLVPDFYDVSKIEKLITGKNLGEMVYVKSLPAKEFAAWAFSGKEYIGVMGFDSSGSISSLEGDFSVYFESFFSKTNRIVTRPLIEIEKLIKKSTDKTLSNQERLRIMIQAEKYLSDNDYLSPLGRVKRVFLYPENVVINEWHDFFSGIPRIDRIL